MQSVVVLNCRSQDLGPGKKRCVKWIFTVGLPSLAARTSCAKQLTTRVSCFLRTAKHYS
jgi:hypothetical protein